MNPSQISLQLRYNWEHMLSRNPYSIAKELIHEIFMTPEDDLNTYFELLEIFGICRDAVPYNGPPSHYVWKPEDVLD